MKQFLLVVMVLSLFSCGEKDSKKTNTLITQEATTSEIDSFLDSDGDGATDLVELKEGTDPYIADIPSFEGEFFQEIEVFIDFYNRTTGTFDRLEWIIEKGKIKLGWEDSPPRKMASGILYMESLLKNYAIKESFSKNYFKFMNYDEGIFSYSAPVLFENEAYLISDKILNLQKRGYSPNNISARILSKFNIKSKKNQYFSDPVFDLYYKSPKHERLIFLESKRIDGTYRFNTDNQVNIVFENFDSNIVLDAFANGGANFFLKMRDFTVYETNERYSKILARVKTQSVPVTIATPSDTTTSKVETIYVGINGVQTSIYNILNLAVKDGLLIKGTSIDQVRGLSNRVQSYGDGTNESLRWFIGTSAIFDNVFNYNYGPGDGIGLAYISDKKVEKKPTYIKRGFVNNSLNSYSSAKFPSDVTEIKIRFNVEKRITPFTVHEEIRRATCHRRGYNYYGDEIYYRSYTGWREEKGVLFLSEVLDELNVNIHRNSNILLTGKLSSLVQKGLVELRQYKGESYADLVFKSSTYKALEYYDGELEIDLKLVPKSVKVEINEERLIRNECKRDPPDLGCRNCIDDKNTEWLNLTNQKVEYPEIQSEVNLHIFGY